MKAIYEGWYLEAKKAGEAAMAAAKPTPMVVGSPKSLFSNELDYSKPVEVVMGGVCGFAWVNIKPGNSGFARYLKSIGVARKDSYYGGVCVWVHEGGQSMQLKEAYAYAFASVISSKGVKCYASSRMD